MKRRRRRGTRRVVERGGDEGDGFT